MKIKRAVAFALALAMLFAAGINGTHAQDIESRRNDKNLRNETIKIGVLMPLTGELAEFGIPSANAIRLAADEVNAAGGINGRQIELIVEDDLSDSLEAANIVTKFVSVDGVHAILGEVASSRTIAAAPIAQQARIPLVAPSATSPEVTGKGDYIFRTCFTNPAQGAAIAQFAAVTLKARRAAFLTDLRNDYSTDLARTIGRTFRKFGGRVVREQSYGEGDQDFLAQLVSIRAAKPDVIFIPGYYTSVGLIARQARRLGIRVPLVGGDGWDYPPLYEVGGAALNGSYFTNHFTPRDTDPKVKRFVRDYSARFGVWPDALAAPAYDAAHILFGAIRRARATDGAAIRDALAKTSDFHGVTGRMKGFDAQRNAIRPLLMLKIVRGKEAHVAERVWVR